MSAPIPSQADDSPAVEGIESDAAFATEAIVPDAPEAAPAPAPEAASAPQEIDMAALEKDIASLGDGYTLQTIVAQTQALKKGMNTAQTELAETRQRYQNFDPLMQQLKSDPSLAGALEETVRKHYDQGYYQADTSAEMNPRTQVPQNVDQTFNPLVQKVNDMETKLANQEMNAEIDRLRDVDGLPITDESRNAIWNRVVETGSGDVRAIAWALLGPQMVRQAADSATKQTAEQIKANNQKYTPPGSGPATPTSPFDVTTMSEADVEDSMLRDLEGMGA